MELIFLNNAIFKFFKKTEKIFLIKFSHATILFLMRLGNNSTTLKLSKRKLNIQKIKNFGSLVLIY